MNDGIKKKSSSGVGLDIGTNMLVVATVGDGGNPKFKMQRDAFFKIVPKSQVNKSSIRMGLEKRGCSFITDSDGSFIVVGQDALEIAVERNGVAQRPLSRGVLSPKEKSSFPMLKLIIKDLLKEAAEGSKVVYSVPAKPIDGKFDVLYHQEVMGAYLSELGHQSQPINEAFAICLSELLDENLTGLSMSFGAGMVNVCVAHQGDPLIEMSITKAGDFIDQSVGYALDVSPSIVQLEKEAGVDLNNPKSKIEEAVGIYYGSVIKYSLKNIGFELKEIGNDLPSFKNPVPVVVSGGLTLAEGFVDKFKACLKDVDFPIRLGEVVRAKNPMTTVANGALLASQL
jgi:hypothetical protein